jgi:hypothetical protein
VGFSLRVDDDGDGCQHDAKGNDNADDNLIIRHIFYGFLVLDLLGLSRSRSAL